jgi:hypothetical protein
MVNLVKLAASALVDGASELGALAGSIASFLDDAVEVLVLLKLSSKTTMGIWSRLE